MCSGVRTLVSWKTTKNRYGEVGCAPGFAMPSSLSLPARSSGSFALPDPVVERFDGDWQNGNPPPLAEYVAANSPDVETYVALICCDMRWRWKSHGASLESSPKVECQAGIVEAYLSHATDVQLDDDHVCRMIKAEFHARQLWGDKPRLQEYHARFPTQFHGCARELKQTLFSLAKVRLSIHCQGNVVFETVVDRPVVLGRQSGEEREPYCRIIRQDTDRIILATATERQVSRNALCIDLESVERVSVLNQSTYTPIDIDSTSVIDPGATASCLRPVRISVAKRLITVS